jgi:SAM-dependent methyltransferase
VIAGRGGFSETGLWQLVESDGYRTDLDYWSRLASRADGPILDLGCGIGRVCHHLNRLGHETHGVDRDPELVSDFNRTRPVGSPPAVTADATRLLDPASPLRGVHFPLVIAPQQLIQILGGRPARLKLFEALPEIVGPEGTVAFAICEELPEASIRYPEVMPDLREVDDWIYSSQPVAIEPGADSVTAVRLRQSLSPDGTSSRREDSVTLDRLDSQTVESELRQAGFLRFDTAPIPETDRHMGSTLLVARPSAA